MTQSDETMARPAQYKREEVLEKAMQTFWRQGYYATSLADLVAATDLRPGSLYAVFPSKEALFLASLDHYGEQGVALIEDFLDKAASPLAGIRAFFQQLADDIAAGRGRRSCFLVNTALELARDNKAVRVRVNRYFERVEACFRRQLEMAQACGELDVERDPAELAAFLVSSIWGLRVLQGARITPSRAQIVIKSILACLD